MGKKVWDEPIDKTVDWAGNESTGGLPVSGAMVQKFIKDSFDGKAGLFYYDTANNRYIVFADEMTKDEYLEDPTKTDLIIGTFDAPFNYTAEINLASPTYNTVYLGDTGNYLDFTFDVKNKQGASTGESVIITYTFIRNATKQVHSQVARHGESIHFNIDKYLGEGVTTIIIGISGQTTLAATTVAVTYNVVSLQLTDETDISIIYDLSSGPKTMEIPFKVKGSGTKVVEWYFDDVLLEFVKNEDEVVEVEAERVKYIQLANLQQGRHSLQIRAYTTINGEKFYTQTLYRDVMVYTGANSNAIVAMAMEIPAKYGMASGSPVIYGMTQYIPYSLRFATHSPGNRTVQVTVKMDNDILGSVSSQNGVVNEFSIVSKISGNRTISLTGEGVSYDIPTVVSKTTMTIEEITSGLKIDFSAIGRNNNSESKDSWEQGDYYGTFEGFEWNDRSGWSENRLKINAGASFGINYAPLANNPKALGRTLEFEFKTLNVNDDNAVICDLRSESGTGILITATKVSVTSENGVVVENEFKSNENVRISIVINRATGTARKGLTLIYANGSISRGVNWAADDNYTSDAQILFKGTSGAEVELKSIRIYESALSDDNILNNFILYRDSVAEMLEVYDRNNVYIEGTRTFSPDKMVSRLPVMIVTGDIPTLENTSDKNTQIIVDIEYTNMQDTSRSFKMVGAAMRPQGTSSMGYPKKNFRIYSRKVSNTILYDANGKIVSDNLYSFKEGAIPVDCWCLKADYAESSGTHNTGIARMWNNALYNVQIDGEYVCRTEAQKAAIAAGYPYDVRTTIDGFPILLFYRRNANDEPIFIGKYNFNNDKSTEKVFGFTDIPGFDNSKMQCWEILNNGNPLALFQTIDGFDYGWSEAYESRYPDTKTPNTDDLKAFSQWMVGVNGNHERFATEKWDHFKIYPMAAYYCYIMRHAAVDQLVKNAMFTSEDGVKFYFIMYDNDTINGLINTGGIDILPTDDRQSVDESGEYKFAGHGSVLWNMLEADTEFMEIVKKIDNALYSAGVSYKECVRIFDEEQADKWVERVYNQDSEYKYVGPYVNQGINNLFMLQGKRDLHRRWWLSKRFSIYDAKFVSGEYKSQSIELKCMNDTPAGQRFSIKAGYPLDYGFGINNGPRETGVTLAVGESHTFETTEVVNLGDPIRIYGAPNIEEVDLSPIANRLAVVTIANVYSESLGTKLKKLILGGDSVNNIEVSEISGLKQAKMLTHLDVRGMKGIKALDLTSQPYFEELKAVGSGVASLSFAKGAPVSRLELPSTMKAITLEQLPNLTSSGLELENIRNINIISIKGCPKLSNDFSWIMSWYNTKNTEDSKCTLIMDNVNWTDVDATQLIALKNLGVLNLKGKVVLSSITLEQLNTLIGVFGETAFDKNSDFFINAPDAIFVSGRTELLEGESEDYNCIVFGGEVKKLTWSIYSGGNSYTSINKDTGVLTITEGVGSRTLTIRVTAITDSGTKIKDLTVTVKARVYPFSSQTSISGPSQLGNPEETYVLSYSVSGITGDMIGEWTLTGMDDFVVIDSHTDSSCVLKILKQATVLKGTLSCKLTKRYNNTSLFTVSREINLVDDTIAETDAGICQALYDAGLTASPTVVTKDEARLITADDLQPGTSYSSSIFYSKSSKIKSFEGFKYFTSVSKIKDYTFSNCTLTKITLPKSLTEISGSFTAYHIVIDSDITKGTVPLPHKANSGITFIVEFTDNVTIANVRLSTGEFKFYSNPRPNSIYDSLSNHLKIIGGKNLITNKIQYSGGLNGSFIDISEAPSISIVYSDRPCLIGNTKLYLKNETIPESATVSLMYNYFFPDKTNRGVLPIVQTGERRFQYDTTGINLYSAIYLYLYYPKGKRPEVKIKFSYTKDEFILEDGTNYLLLDDFYTSSISLFFSDVEGLVGKASYSFDGSGGGIVSGGSPSSAFSTVVRGPRFYVTYTPSAELFIQHINGTLYSDSQWSEGGFTAEEANGIACTGEGFLPFVVCPKIPSIPENAIGGYGVEVNSVICLTKQQLESGWEAFEEKDGVVATTNLREELEGVTGNNVTGSPVAEALLNFTFPDGKTHGYLPTILDLAVVLNYRYQYETLAKKIGAYVVSNDINYACCVGYADDLSLWAMVDSGRGGILLSKQGRISLYSTVLTFGRIETK